MGIFDRLFGKKETAGKITSLIQATRIGPWEQQYKAINELKCLHQAGDAQVIAQLMEALGDPHAEARSVTIKILKEPPFRDDPRVVGPIIRVLEDENPRVRYEAAYALADIKPSAAVTPLIAVLTDEDESVQEYAVYALGEICNPRAVEPLKRLYPMTTEKVKKRIDQALGKIRKVFPEM